LLFQRTALSPIMPSVVVAVSCLLLGRYFLVPGRGRALRARRRTVGLLLILYWLPIALVTAFSSGEEEPYLLPVHPLPLSRCPRAGRRWRARAPRHADPPRLGSRPPPRLRPPPRRPPWPALVRGDDTLRRRMRRTGRPSRRSRPRRPRSPARSRGRWPCL